VPTRRRRVVVLALAGFTAAAVAVTAIAQAPRTETGGPGSGPGLDTAMRELGIVPLNGQRARPFALPALHGRRLALDDLAGRAALLYFWATW
jgi:hypothetical protein